MHVRSAQPDAVRLAIDQCAQVGFELVILTFGSGFDIENEKPEYLAQFKETGRYARVKGIALGGYSLLASRSIDQDNDVINPQTGKTGGARFGNSPCLGSHWGQDYFRKLRQFFEKTGCSVLEHDGSYPAIFAPPPITRATLDWPILNGSNGRSSAGFTNGASGRGIYLNVPDWYYLAGSSKCGMGYRETIGPCPASNRKSSNGKIFSMARGRKPRAWAGCSCRSPNTKAAVRQQRSSH